MSVHEDTLAFQLKSLGVIDPEREYRFSAREVGLGPGIKQRLQEARLKDWRFDFAWPDQMFAVEVEGGGGTGRHTTAKGFRQDMEKYHHAMRLGWAVYRCDGGLVKRGEAAQLIEQLLPSQGKSVNG